MRSRIPLVCENFKYEKSSSTGNLLVQRAFRYGKSVGTENPVVQRARRYTGSVSTTARDAREIDGAAIVQGGAAGPHEGPAARRCGEGVHRAGLPRRIRRRGRRGGGVLERGGV